VAAPDFIPLADVIRSRTSAAGDGRENRRHAAEAHDGALLRLVPPPHETLPPQNATAQHDVDDPQTAMRDAVRDARLFRARLADAFGDSLGRLMREVAVRVLARELRLEPCDLAAIVRCVANDVPVVRVRLARADASDGAARGCGLPVVEDPALDAGDVVLEVAGGAVDARLGVRLAALLEEYS
jgi:hypothetical protein